MKNLLSVLNDMPADSRAKAVTLLNRVLASVFDLYSQSKQAHWNVRGSDFYSYHKLFDEAAESIEGFADEIAERVVALGGVARGTVREAGANSVLSEFPTEGKNGIGYVRSLAGQFVVCAKVVRAGVDEATVFGDAGTADLLTGLSRALDKTLWFLDAHLRE